MRRVAASRSKLSHTRREVAGICRQKCTSTPHKCSKIRIIPRLLFPQPPSRSEIQSTSCGHGVIAPLRLSLTGPHENDPRIKGPSPMEAEKVVDVWALHSLLSNSGHPEQTIHSRPQSRPMRQAISKLSRRVKPGHSTLPDSVSTSIPATDSHPKKPSMTATPSTSSPSASLQGKVAIITGGSKGIGKATSIALARLGATVVINYSSDEEAAQGVLAEVQKLGAGEARLVRADSSTLDGVQSLVKQTVDAYSKIDVLIPNAGVLPMKDLEHTTEADFDRTFAINVKGPYFLAQVRPSNPYKARHAWPDMA